MPVVIWIGSGAICEAACAQVLAISRYDGRGAMSLQDSVKSQHILPFFPNFVLLATRLEGLLAGTQGHSSGDAACLLHPDEDHTHLPLTAANDDITQVGPSLSRSSGDRRHSCGKDPIAICLAVSLRSRPRTHD